MQFAKQFRTVALVEATTFLALLVATAVKYGADAPIGVEILGPIHGALVLLYVALAVIIARSERWRLLELIGVLLGAVVPFGGFVVDRWMQRRKAASAPVAP